MAKDLAGFLLRLELLRGSIPGPLLFLICINDLADGLNSIAKLFPNDTSLFPIFQDLNDLSI